MSKHPGRVGWVAIQAIALGALIGATADGARGAEPDGKALYAAECAKCHGATGNADTAVGKAMKAASLHDPKLAGADGAATIVGHVRSDPKHATISKKLSDADLKAIAAFVQGFAAAK